MKVISSGSTRFQKYIFPAIWLGALLLIFLAPLKAGVPRRDPMFFIGPVLMAVVGILIFKKLVWGLADEVRDGGDYLVVRRGSDEVTIRLVDVINVSESSNTNPPRVTLRLAQPTKFGDEVAFMPVRQGFSLNPFKRNAIVEDLIVRVDKARRGSGR